LQTLAGILRSSAILGTEGAEMSFFLFGRKETL
jgi:hypothetical protein